MRLIRIVGGMIAFVTCLMFVEAQTDSVCSIVMETAISNLNTHCDTTGRNEACYGHHELTALPQANIEELDFESPGDIESVVRIQSLQLSGFDEEAELYSMALMRLQANIPDSIPGTNITIILFGETTIESADTQETESQTSPSTETNAAFQAIYLRTGITGTQCEDLPEDGVLIQSPRGVDTVTFDINEVRIELGSTAYITAIPNDVMTIYLLEGQAVITAFGESLTLPEGTFVTIPLDENGIASGVPNLPEVYDDVALTNLPLSTLPDAIDIARSIPELSAETPNESPADEAQTSSEELYFNLTSLPDGSTTCVLPSARVGQQITLNFGTGLWDTAAEADTRMASSSSTISVNGTALPVERARNFCDACSPQGYGYETRALWIPSATGVYTINGVDFNASHTCSITIEN